MDMDFLALVLKHNIILHHKKVGLKTVLYASMTDNGHTGIRYSTTAWTHKGAMSKMRFLLFKELS